MLAVLLAAVVVGGWLRWLIVGLGGALALLGLGRFVVRTAAPNIIDGGRHSSEEHAVDRLREIRWAQIRAKEAKALDENHDGIGEYLSLGELAGAGGRHLALERPILTGVYLTPRPSGVFLSSAYLYTVYLPSPDHFVAYAWPVRLDQGGGRAFSIDEHDQICESTNLHAGETQIPVAEAAQLVGGTCGSGTESTAWHRWTRRERNLPIR